MRNAACSWSPECPPRDIPAICKQILNQLPHPILLVDGQHSILFSNCAAESSLKSADFILQRNGAIRCRDAESDLQLADAIQALYLPATGGTSPNSQRKFVRIRKASGDPIAVYAIALSIDAPAAAAPISLALLMLRDPMQEAPLDLSIVMELFGLTPAEARTCVNLASGISPEDAAKAHGTAVSTVRTQLKAIYRKTRARGLADLMRMMSSVGAPLGAFSGRASK